MAARARLALVLTLSALAVPAAAWAGRYDVVACGDATGSVASSWSMVNNDPAPPATGTVHSGNGCGGQAVDAGLFVRERLGPGPNPGAGSFAYWAFDAPPGTRITGLSYSRFLEKILDDDSWQIGLRADGGREVEGCHIELGSDACRVGAEGGRRVAFALADSSLRFGAWCVPYGAATGCDNGSSLQSAHAVLYGATVTLEESLAPSVSARASGLLSGAWVTGAQALAATAGDATGIRRFRLTRDGAGVVVAQEKSCDPTLVLPCDAPGGTSAWQGDVDSALLPDGTHQIRVQAYDAASNLATTAARTVRADNTAPQPPNSLRLDGPATTAAAVRLRWLQPPTGGGSPNAAEVFELCPLPAGTCTSSSTPVDQGEDLLLATGDYRARVWTIDAVGLGSAAQAAAIDFRVTAVEPGAAEDVSAQTPAAELLTTETEPEAPPRPLAIERRSPGLGISSARRKGRRIAVRGTVDQVANGARVTLRIGARTALATVRGGRFAATIVVPRRSRATRVLARIAASSLLRAGTARAQIRT